jgi:flagellar basal-body rod modification protein FlgD
MTDYTSAIGASNATSASSAASSVIGGLGGDTFLKLLVAQLKYQNPMEPTDGTQFLQQTAQFTQVETLQELAKTQQSLMNLTQFSLAVGLSGKSVDALGNDGQRFSGTVSSIQFTADGPQLEVGDQWVPIQNVVEVNPVS